MLSQSTTQQSGYVHITTSRKQNTVQFVLLTIAYTEGVIPKLFYTSLGGFRTGKKLLHKNHSK